MLRDRIFRSRTCLTWTLFLVLGAKLENSLKLGTFFLPIQEVPEDEQNLGGDEILVPVAHFNKVRNQMECAMYLSGQIPLIIAFI